MDAANPIGTILSAAMMLRYSFDLTREADAVEAAVDSVLEQGYRTADILGADPSCIRVGCREMGEKIEQALRRIAANGERKDITI